MTAGLQHKLKFFQLQLEPPSLEPLGKTEQTDAETDLKFIQFSALIKKSCNKNIN